MDRVVRINVKDVNICTGLLISLDSDKENDVILTVAHIFGEEKDAQWEMWEIGTEDIEITSDYYGCKFQPREILYRKSDAAMQDIALIYIEKVSFQIQSSNLSVLDDSKLLIGQEVILEGYGQEQANETTRVINGTIHDFTDADKIMYRINYLETDRVGNTTTATINKGMSGAPVYSYRNGCMIFAGMQKMVPSEQTTDGILGIFTYNYCIQVVKDLYEVELTFENNISKAIKNEPLFKKIHVLQQTFEIVPSHKPHMGASIDYSDLTEVREEFITELVNTSIDWMCCLEKYNDSKQELIEQGRSETTANRMLIKKIENQFRREITETYSAQVRLCDLLLFHFIQRYMKATPLLRRANIFKDKEQEIASADVIHYKKENTENIIILGKALCFTKQYEFEESFLMAVESILETYKKHTRNLNLYVHEDFLDEEMDILAESYINRTMPSPKIHLVCLVMYEETTELNITEEKDIRDQIETIIRSRYTTFPNTYLDMNKNPILNRITYIIFPTWDIEDLVEMFREYI